MLNINLNELRARACVIVHNDSSIEKGRPLEYGNLLVVTKLFEATVAYREERRADRDHFEFEGKRRFPGNDQDLFECFIKDTFEDKLADAVILLLAFAEEGNVDMNSWGCPLNAVRFENFFSQKPEHITYCIYHVIARFIREKDVHSAIRLGIVGIFALADGYDIDLSWHIIEKMKYRESKLGLNEKNTNMEKNTYEFPNLDVQPTIRVNFDEASMKKCITVPLGTTISIEATESSIVITLLEPKKNKTTEVK